MRINDIQIDLQLYVYIYIYVYNPTVSTSDQRKLVLDCFKGHTGPLLLDLLLPQQAQAQ